MTIRSLSSWVIGADSSGFGLNNLPYGVADPGNGPVVVNAIGAYCLDLAACAEAGILSGITFDPSVMRASSLNPFLDLGADLHTAIRERVQTVLSEVAFQTQVSDFLLSLDEVKLLCPLAPGDFIDFYSNYHHATRALVAMGLDGEPLENWFSMPVGYHSRCGTLLGPNDPVRRPHGQRRSRNGPVFEATRALDFEAELGFVSRMGSVHGQRLTPDDFESAVFGMVLLNDWSARDFQMWESRPLGPLLAKSFASQVGAWVVPLEALGDARIISPAQSGSLDYLAHDAPWGFDISIDVFLSSEAMRASGVSAKLISETNFKHMHWNSAQQLAHATANGASIRPGDLFGSGTISGPERGSEGCLLEMTQFGKTPLEIDAGDTRTWLDDGDVLTIEGAATNRLGETVSFGAMRGTIGIGISK